MASATPITLHFDEHLVLSAVLTFWRRKVGVGFFAALVVLGGATAFLFSQGDRGWLIGASIAVLALGILIAATLFVAHYRGSMGKLRRMSPPEATLSITDDGLSLASSLASSTIRWSSVSEVWQTPSFWLLFLSPAQFITLPTAEIPKETLEVIRARVAEAGGRVA